MSALNVNTTSCVMALVVLVVLAVALVSPSLGALATLAVAVVGGIAVRKRAPVPPISLNTFIGH